MRVAIDIDAGLRMGGQHVGPKRSPLHDADDVVGLARHDRPSAPGFALVGVMTYEGQVAGVPDDVPAPAGQVAGRTPAQGAPRWPSSTSDAAEIAAAAARGGRAGVLERRRLRLASRPPAADPAVTEVAAGSGLLVPGLFDHYQSFDAAARRRSSGCRSSAARPPAIATVHGGGLVASGPTGKRPAAPSRGRRPACT